MKLEADPMVQTEHNRLRDGPWDSLFSLILESTRSDTVLLQVPQVLVILLFS